MRSVDPRLWTDPEFLRLSPDAKLVFLCWATGPVGGTGGAVKALTGLDDSRLDRAVYAVADAQLFLDRAHPGGPGLYRHVSRHTHPSAVYFVQSGDGLIKIGWTNDVETRLATLQTGCPEELNLLALVIGTQSDERRMHQRFAHLRARGEWFEPAREIIDYIRAIDRGEVEELA